MLYYISHTYILYTYKLYFTLVLQVAMPKAISKLHRSTTALANIFTDVLNNLKIQYIYIYIYIYIYTYMLDMLQGFCTIWILLLHQQLGQIFSDVAGLHDLQYLHYSSNIKNILLQFSFIKMQCSIFTVYMVLILLHPLE